MSNNIKVTGSYLQESRHSLVSEKYNVITPAAVGEVMIENGLQLATLSTGRARHEDKVDFQKTYARYRGPEILPGINLDVLTIAPHLGRGQYQVLLGIFRLVCANGMITGETFFKSSIRHSGNTYDNLTFAVQDALSKHKELSDLITRMQSIQTNTDTVRQLVETVTGLLVPKEATNVKEVLTRVRRADDNGNDLWSVFNRIQENAMHGGAIGYQLVKEDETGKQTVRYMTTRRIKTNSEKDTNFNQGFFEVAAKLAA